MNWRKEIRAPGFTKYFVMLIKLVDGFIAIFPALIYWVVLPAAYSEPDGSFGMVFFFTFISLFTVLIFQVLELYENELFSNKLRLRLLFSAWSVTFCLLMLIWKGSGILSQLHLEIMLIWFLLSFSLFVLKRLCVLRLFVYWHSQQAYLQRSVILGYTESGCYLAEHLRNSWDIRSGLIGFIDDRVKRYARVKSRLPILGDMATLEYLIRTEQVDQVLVAIPWKAEGRIGHLLEKLRQLPVDVLLVPDMAAFRHTLNRVEEVAGVTMYNLSELPLNGWAPLLKRLEDFVLACLALVPALPVMLLIALAIKLESRGPVFFLQNRYGYNNKLIRVIKFRSMYVEHEDSDAAVQTVRDDPRITRVGRVIRKSSLDELPQLFNVLCGSMSMVGPRPHATATKAEGVLFEEAVANYSARHRVRPGITGWAQINGYRGETDKLFKLQKRVEYDLEYIAKWSVWFDLYILVRTVPAILFKEEVY